MSPKALKVPKVPKVPKARAAAPKNKKKGRPPPLEPRSSEIDQLESDSEAPLVSTRDGTKGDEETDARPRASTSNAPSNGTNAGLERFRCPLRGDGTPSSDVMNHSSLPLKRPRPQKDIPPTRSPQSKATPRSSRPATTSPHGPQHGSEAPLVSEDNAERPTKRKKSRLEAAQSPRGEIVFILPEIDEDGNPIESPSLRHSSPRHSQARNNSPGAASAESRSPSIALSRSRAQSRSPLRSVSPHNRASPLAPLSEGRDNKVLSSRALESSESRGRSRDEKARSISPPSSSPSKVVPSQMLRRIKASHETKPPSSPPIRSPSQNQATREETTTVDGATNRSGSGQHKLSAEARSQIAETLDGLLEADWGGFEMGDSDSDADATRVDEGRWHGVPSLEEKNAPKLSTIIPSARQSPVGSGDPSDPQRRLFGSTKLQSPSKAHSSRASGFDRSLDSAAPVPRATGAPLASSFSFTREASRPKPIASHRLVPLSLQGLTSLMQELVESAVHSTEPLTRFGLSDSLSSTSESNPDGFSRGEVGYLRREVDRLTTEVVERNRTISILSEQVRAAARDQERLRDELTELDDLLRTVEDERDRARERLDWMKEAKRGLLREMREVEERCEQLEAELGNGIEWVEGELPGRVDAVGQGDKQMTSEN